MEFESGPPEDAAVAQGLAALKRDGGSVLVAGAVCDAQRDVCERFLEGDGPAVLVDTDRPVREGDARATAVLERPFRTRSAAPCGAGSPTSDIGSLTADLEATMREHAASGPLRVCFDSVGPFVDVTDAPTLASALSDVREAARDIGAVVHFHLPAMPEVVPRVLFEAVDAVVEVRRRAGTTYQRWRFVDGTEPTDWAEV